MWLATKGGFLSAVEVKPGGGIVVRAREKAALQHLARYSPTRKLKIERTVGRDYLFRAYLSREDFASAAAAMAADIDYGNFKDRVLAEAKAGRVSKKYEEALHRVWTIFGDTQLGGPYGWHLRRRRRRRRGAELDLGPFGTWPDEVSVEHGLRPSLHEEYEEWLEVRGIDRAGLTSREDALLVSEWGGSVDGDPLDPRFA